MITLVLFLVLIGFFFLYHTSQRATPPRSLTLEQWINNKPSVAKPVGLGLLVLSLIMSAMIFGLGAGALFFFIMLMALASLVIILSPVKVLSYKGVSSIVLLTLIFEILI